ncbi:hypothetical protein MPSEU_000094500 [Mayamaea pseudoterrestris]|nr:hypothetical protein MPSEU_000094500 [Mayamaea pseudoterrestris]
MAIIQSGKEGTPIAFHVESVKGLRHGPALIQVNACSCNNDSFGRCSESTTFTKSEQSDNIELCIHIESQMQGIELVNITTFTLELRRTGADRKEAIAAIEITASSCLANVCRARATMNLENLTSNEQPIRLLVAGFVLVQIRSGRERFLRGIQELQTAEFAADCPVAATASNSKANIDRVEAMDGLKLAVILLLMVLIVTGACCCVTRKAGITRRQCFHCFTVRL